MGVKHGISMTNSIVMEILVGKIINPPLFGLMEDENGGKMGSV